MDELLALFHGRKLLTWELLSLPSSNHGNLCSSEATKSRNSRITEIGELHECRSSSRLGFPRAQWPSHILGF